MSIVEREEIVTVNGHITAKLPALLSVGVCLSFCAFAEFVEDRSAMSEAYWKIWNDDVQAKIDADIEKYRKADASVSKECSKLVDVK